MSGGREGKVVAVTGASGYIASWLVKLLLQRGYNVKASIRDLSDSRKAKFLMAMDGAKERLELFQANLLEEGSFDAVIDGCEGVFHTASPVQFSISETNVQADLLDPAVKGTLNVLRSCAKFSSVRRVILTSSMAAVSHNNNLKDGVMVDETWISDPSYCKDHKFWYELSKILAENAAWEFSKEHKIDMIVINPGMVIGPILQSSASSSVGWILNLINGTQPPLDVALTWVDVRDVAYAHILAFEIPSASGRYCVIERFAHLSELIKILIELFPALQFPDICSIGSTSPQYRIKHEVSNEKVKGLGIEFIPLEVSLKDTIESFKEMNLISI